MKIQTKDEIFGKQLAVWLKADRKSRGKIIDSMCLVTGLHRKSVSRKFSNLQMKSKGKKETRGRKKYYGKDTEAALRMIWEASGGICGDLLYGVIKDYVSVFKGDGSWYFSQETTDKLLRVSMHTVRRKVEKWSKGGSGKRGLSSTNPSHLKTLIPIFKGPWDNLPPGNGQLDTVAHCGGSLKGNFVYTLNYTDFATYWVELSAQWNKGQAATIESLDNIRKRLPFNLEMIHPDSGSEFININLKTYTQKRGIKLTRSEPNRKNDNMAVEERNGHLVREALGYDRLDQVELLPLINEYLRLYCLFRNHFVPSKRTISKHRQGAKYVRHREYIPLTPYQRVLENSHLKKSYKQKLQDIHHQLHPIKLRRRYDYLCGRIFTTLHANRQQIN
jgi:hypothetical protein